MARMPVEERRRTLIDATLALVAREGVSRATARAIVTEAGMPLGALHYAFDSVESLLDAAAAAVTEQERLAAQGVVTLPPGATMLDILTAGLVGYVDLLREDPGRELAYLELTLHAARRRMDRPPGRGAYAHAYEVVGALLDQAATAAGVRWTEPTALLARQTVVVLDGITTTWLADHDDDAAVAAARLHAALLTRLSVPITEDPHAD